MAPKYVSETKMNPDHYYIENVFFTVLKREGGARPDNVLPYNRVSPSDFPDGLTDDIPSPLSNHLCDCVTATKFSPVSAAFLLPWPP